MKMTSGAILLLLLLDRSLAGNAMADLPVF
jgi:hypothetical protein